MSILCSPLLRAVSGTTEQAFAFMAAHQSQWLRLNPPRGIDARALLCFATGDFELFLACPNSYFPESSIRSRCAQVITDENKAQYVELLLRHAPRLLCLLPPILSLFVGRHLRKLYDGLETRARSLPTTVVRPPRRERDTVLTKTERDKRETGYHIK